MLQGHPHGALGASQPHGQAHAAAGGYLQQHYSSGAYDPMTASLSPSSAGAAAAVAGCGYGGSSSGGGRGGRLAAATAAAAEAAGYGSFRADSTWGEQGGDYRAAMAAGMAAAAVADSLAGAAYDDGGAYGQQMGVSAAVAAGEQGMSYMRHLQQQLAGHGVAAPPSPQAQAVRRGAPGAGSGGVSPSGRSLGRLDAVAAVAAAKLQASSSSGSHADAAEGAGVQDFTAADLLVQQQRRQHLLFPAEAPRLGDSSGDLVAVAAAAAAVAGAGDPAVIEPVQQLGSSKGPATAAMALAAGCADQAHAGPEEEDVSAAGPPVPGSKAYRQMQHQLKLLALHAGLDPEAAAAAAAAAAEAAHLQQQLMGEDNMPYECLYSQQQQQQQPTASHDDHAAAGDTAGARRSGRPKRRRRFSADTDGCATESEPEEGQDWGQEGVGLYAGTGDEEHLDAGGYGAAEVLESLQGYCGQPVHAASGGTAAAAEVRRATASPSVSGASGSRKRGAEVLLRSPRLTHALSTAPGLVAVGSASGSHRGMGTATTRTPAGFGAQQGLAASAMAAAAAAPTSHVSEPLVPSKQLQGVDAMLRSVSSSAGIRGALHHLHHHRLHVDRVLQLGSSGLDSSAATAGNEQHHRLSNTDTATCLFTHGSEPDGWELQQGSQQQQVDCDGGHRATVASGNVNPLPSSALPAAGSGDFAAHCPPSTAALGLDSVMAGSLRRSSNDSTCMPGQLSTAAGYIADVLESAVCATVLKALPPVLAGFSQCVVKALAAAATQQQQQQQGAGSPGGGEQQQLMKEAAEELLRGLQAACQKAISAEAVAELMQSGPSIQALMVGREQLSGPQQQSGPQQLSSAAVTALAMAANAAGGMGQQELATAASAARR